MSRRTSGAVLAGGLVLAGAGSDTVARATVEQSSGRDRTLVVPTRFGLGVLFPVDD